MNALLTRISDKPFRGKGFTLIELMIVITIGGLILGLVGPLAIDSLAKARARSELVSMQSWLRYQSHRAFLLGQEVRITFNGHQVSGMIGLQGDTEEWRKLEHLRFTPQQLVINKRGIADKVSVEAILDDDKHVIQVFNWKAGDETK